MIQRNPIPELVRKWSRATDLGRSMRFSAAEMDALNAVGVGDLIGAKAAEMLRQMAIERQAQREGANKPAVTFTDHAPHEAEGRAALRRALELTSPQHGQLPPLTTEAIAALTSDAPRPSVGKGRRRR